MSKKESLLSTHVTSCMNHRDDLSLMSSNVVGNASNISVKESCKEGSSLDHSSPTTTPLVPATEGKRSWNNLFKEKQLSSQKLEYFPPLENHAGGKYSISPPPEVADEGAKKWEKCDTTLANRSNKNYNNLLESCPKIYLA